VVPTQAQAAPSTISAGALYLALGDSGPFGTDPRITDAGKGGDPKNFVGYPEMLAQALSLNLTNAACPGETSGSLLDVNDASAGCRSYQKIYPLKVSYRSRSQIDFAIEHLRANPRTALITISIGGNDVGNLLERCAGDQKCISDGYPAVLDTLRRNVTRTYARLRDEGGFKGTLVGVLGVPIDYRNAGSVDRTTAYNDVIASVTRSAGGVVADIFPVFRTASQPSLDQCAAGLRIQLSTDPLRCDSHHSELGRQLVTRTIREALPR
jgi:lysophospholipase L1-like esterase